MPKEEKSSHNEEKSSFDIGPTFRKELINLINRHSTENLPNTSDVQLADFLFRCLKSSDTDFQMGAATIISNMANSKTDSDFQTALTSLINKYSKELPLKMPAHLLSYYIIQCIKNLKEYIDLKEANERLEKQKRESTD